MRRAFVFDRGVNAHERLGQSLAGSVKEMERQASWDTWLPAVEVVHGRQ